MKLLKRIGLIFYERNPEGCMSRWWHALAYRDYMRMQSVMVIWPFHYVVQLLCWLNLQWDVYRHRKSWIDRHVEAAVKRSEESDARRYIRRALRRN